MNKKLNSGKSSSKDPRFINHQLREFRFIVWVGALFRYFANFGSQPFNTFYKPESDKLNFIIGFLIQLTVIIMIIAITLFFQLRSVRTL